jgi:integrase/recombinase XerC
MSGHVIPLRPEGLERDETYANCLSFLCNERAESTAHAYLQDIRYLGEYLGLADVVDVVRNLLECSPMVLNQQIQDWRRFMVEDRQLSPNTVNRRLSAIRSLLCTARSLGLTSNELALRKVAGRPVRDVSGPDAATVALMLDRLTRDSCPRAARDACLVCLAFSLGLRRHELHLLNVPDIDLQASKVSVVCKGGGRQELALPLRSREIVARWLDYRVALSSTSPLFVNLSTNGHMERLSTTSIYNIVRKAGEVAGSVVPVRPHGLRRAGINQAFSVAGIYGACAFARHQDIGTTVQYIDTSDSVRSEISEILDAGLATTNETETGTDDPGNCDIVETPSWL